MNLARNESRQTPIPSEIYPFKYESRQKIALQKRIPLALNPFRIKWFSALYILELKKYIGTLKKIACNVVLRKQ